MSGCKTCGSFAINHNLHGRDGSDGDLCDVCYWRVRSDGSLEVLEEADEVLTGVVLLRYSNMHNKIRAVIAKTKGKA